MLILGLDFETLGLDPKIHAVCEVGAQLWDTEYHRAVQSMGVLVQVPENSPFEEDAMKATKLSLELIAKYGKDSVRSLKQLLNMYDQADAVCAHNGNTCDRLFLRAWMKACGITDDIFPENKLWIDTLTDIEYPKKWSRQLTALAAYHGFLNPFPHQALGDVMTMLHILDRYPIDQVIETARTPLIGVRLLNITFDEREWAKTRGFFPYRGKDGKFRFWMKTLKDNKFQGELEEALGFKYSLEKIEIPEGVY